MKNVLSKLETIIWQSKNSKYLFKQKNVNEETIKLFKVPDGQNGYSLFGYGGSKGLDPIKEVKVEENLILNSTLEHAGPVSTGKNNTARILSTKDIATGKLLYTSDTSKGYYFDRSNNIDWYKLSKLGIKIDSTKPVEFKRYTDYDVNKKIDNTGYLNDYLRGSITKVETNKGTLIQMVESCKVPKSEIYPGVHSNEKVSADKITLYLNGEKIKEYYSDISCGSKCIG